MRSFGKPFFPALEVLERSKRMVQAGRRHLGYCQGRFSLLLVIIDFYYFEFCVTTALAVFHAALGTFVILLEMVADVCPFPHAIMDTDDNATGHVEVENG
jgi:hypothetical protein